MIFDRKTNKSIPLFLLTILLCRMTIANTEMVHGAWCYSNYIHNRQTTNADFFSLFAVNDILDICN